MPEQIEEMDFCDAVELFNHWSKSPTLTMMIQSYFGIEEQADASDPMAIAAAMKAMGAAGKAEKVSKAPVIDQERFAMLREQLEKMKKRENGRS